MTGILLFLLFMLNMLTILAVILLYKRQNRLLEMENSERDNKEETAEIFSAFLLELKEENEQFISKVSQLKGNEGLRQTEEKMEKHNPNDDQQVDITQELPITSKAYSELLAYQSYGKNVDSELPPSKAGNEIKKELSLNEQVTRLNEEGFTIEEIAKTLHKGKTEIELMLKFSRSSQNT